MVKQVAKDLDLASSVSAAQEGELPLRLVVSHRLPYYRWLRCRGA